MNKILIWKIWLIFYKASIVENNWEHTKRFSCKDFLYIVLYKHKNFEEKYCYVSYEKKHKIDHSVVVKNHDSKKFNNMEIHF